MTASIRDAVFFGDWSEIASRRSSIVLPFALTSNGRVAWRGEWRAPEPIRVAGSCPAPIARVAAMLGRPIVEASATDADIVIGAIGGRIAVLDAPAVNGSGSWRATPDANDLFPGMKWASLAGARAAPATRLSASLTPLVSDVDGALIGRDASGCIVIGVSIEAWSKHPTFPVAWKSLLERVPGGAGALIPDAPVAREASPVAERWFLSPWIVALAMGLAGAALAVLRPR
jgi:hypothetical protein